MSEILRKIKCERKNVSCLADYNILSLNYDTHSPTQEFTDLLYSHSLLPCITRLTRVTAKSASLIDNIFCNSVLYDDHAFTGILYTDVSDHFPSFFYIDGSSENIAQFSLKLRARDWSDLLACNDLEIAYTFFSNIITELFDTCFPLRTVKHGYKTIKPWLTESLKKSIRRNNKLYHWKQKFKNEEHGQLYKQYRNTLNKLLNLTEQQHFDNLLKEDKNNFKSSWRIIKDIISKINPRRHAPDFMLMTAKILLMIKKIAANLNSLFINVGPNLTKKISPTSQSPTSFMTRNCDSMVVLPVNQSEIIDIIRNLQHSSPGGMQLRQMS